MYEATDTDLCSEHCYKALFSTLYNSKKLEFTPPISSHNLTNTKLHYRKFLLLLHYNTILFSNNIHIEFFNLKKI